MLRIWDYKHTTHNTQKNLTHNTSHLTLFYETNTHKFTGHERDSETALDYMLARYCDSTYGKFLQPDLGYDYDQMDPMSFNLYGYVRGNPVIGVDPDGEEEAYIFYDLTFVKEAILMKNYAVAEDYLKTIGKTYKALVEKHGKENVYIRTNPTLSDYKKLMKDKDLKTFVFFGHGGNYSKGANPAIEIRTKDLSGNQIGISFNLFSGEHTYTFLSFKVNEQELRFFDGGKILPNFAKNVNAYLFLCFIDTETLKKFTGWNAFLLGKLKVDEPRMGENFLNFGLSSMKQILQNDRNFNVSQEHLNDMQDTERRVLQNQ